MSRSSVLARAQAAALAGMRDTCTIRRRTGATTNPDTGVSSPAYAQLYAGVCRVQHARPLSRPANVGEDFVLILAMDIQLPLSVTGLAVGDEITIDTAVNDPDLPGRVFRIHDLFHKSEPSSRRVGVIERTG